MDAEKSALIGKDEDPERSQFDQLSHKQVINGRIHTFALMAFCKLYKNGGLFL